MNLDTIIQKYCVNKDKPAMQCNGKCHLAKQMQLTQPTGDGQPIDMVLQAFFPVFIVDFPTYDIRRPLQSYFKPIISSNVDSYIFLLESHIYKPPIC